MCRGELDIYSIFQEAYSSAGKIVYLYSKEEMMMLVMIMRKSDLHPLSSFAYNSNVSKLLSFLSYDERTKV